MQTAGSIPVWLVPLVELRQVYAFHIGSSHTCPGAMEGTAAGAWLPSGGITQAVNMHTGVKGPLPTGIANTLSARACHHHGDMHA